HQAGAHRLAIDNHRAGTANAMLAADVRPRLSAFVADGIDQRLARFDRDRVGAAVDRKHDVAFFTHAPLPVARTRAFIRSFPRKRESRATRESVVVAPGSPRHSPRRRAFALKSRG